MSTVLLAAVTPARAQDATWLATPMSGDWNTAVNWSPAAVPTASTTTVFGPSTIKALSIAANTSVGAIRLNEAGYSFDLSAGTTFTVGGNDTDTLVGDSDNSAHGSGVISGAGSLVKVGTGTLTLTEINTYTGDTVVTAGTLALGNNPGFGYGSTGRLRSAVTVNPGATLLLNGVNVLGNAASESNASVRRITLDGGTLIHAGAGDNGWNMTYTLSGATMQTTHPTGRFSFGGNNENTSVHSFGDTGSTIAGTIRLREGSGGLNPTNQNENRIKFTVEEGAAAHDLLISANIAEEGGKHGIVKLGAGTLTLSGENTYNGVTTVSEGTLQIGAGGTSGSIRRSVVIADGATLAFNRSDNHRIFNSLISGAGALELRSGTLALFGNNTYSGGTTIRAGSTLQVGLGVSFGRLGPGPVTNDGALVLNHSGALTFGGTVSGAGTVTKIGPSILTLTGQTSTGLTTISSGTLRVDGLISGAVQVDSGATLGGTGTAGTLGSAVTIADGGHLAPGVSPGTLNLGSLMLNGTSQLDYEFGLANVFGGAVNDLTVVAGDLTLDGVLNVSDLGGFGAREVLAGGAFGPGVYRLFEYTGNLIDNGLELNLPAGFDANNVLVQTGAGQVNLIVVAGDFTMQFWDGANAAAGVEGGSSVWNPTSTNWTTSDGTVNAPWQRGLAVFQAAPGTVTLAEDIEVSAMQFLTDGYRIDGAGFDLQAMLPEASINVATGTTTVDARIVDGAGAPSGVFKYGDGLLILGADNDYSGGTSIRSGALQVARDTNLGRAGSNLVLDHGTLITTGTFESERMVTLGADGGTFSPAAGTILTLNNGVGGDGQFHKAGDGTVVLNGANTFGGGLLLSAGTLTLTADNSYSGDTNIEAGTLQIGNGGAAGSVTGNISNSGSLIFNRSGELAFGGGISGVGTLTKLGAGTLTLTGDNDYSGGTTISGGTLQIGDGGAGGSIVGDVTNNGVLIFNRSDEFAQVGRISGSGSVTQAGSGLLTLSGDHTYSGGTTIASGTLQLGDLGSRGSVVGNITNNGTLVFNSPEDVGTFDGIVSGAGSVAYIGAGTLILNNDNTFTGPTTITNGTLQLGNGGTRGGLVGDITNDGTLVFDRSNDVVYAGAINGSGSVVKDALSTLTFTGTSSYTGTTTVNAGRLLVDGVIVSPVNVLAGANLGGIGSVGSILNSGQVSPGASIGTLNVTGNFAQAPSGTLDIELDDRGGVDVLNVSGAATLAGSVTYLPDPASTFGQDVLYTYLNAGGGVSGTFSNPALQQLAGVALRTIHNPDSVQVQVASIPLTNNIGPGAGNLVACIGSLNAQRSAPPSAQSAAVLGALVTMPVGSFVQAAAGICPRDTSVLPSAVHSRTSARFGQLGNRIAEAQQTIEDPSAAGFFDTYRLREGVDLWLRGSYQDGAGDARDVTRPGYDSINQGYVLGLDVAVAESSVVGGYLARDELDVDYRGPVSDTAQADMDGWTLGLYGSYWSMNAWFVQGLLEYGWHDLDSTRDMTLNTVALRAQGERDANAFAAATGAGYNFAPSASWLIQPQLSLSYERFAEDAFTETGAQALNLAYSDVDADTLRSEAGVTVRKSLVGNAGLAPEITVVYAYANYVYDWALDDRDRTAQFTIAQPFDVSADEGNRDGIRYGVGFENTWADDASVQLLLDAEDYGEIENLSATLQVRKRF